MLTFVHPNEYIVPSHNSRAALLTRIYARTCSEEHFEVVHVQAKTIFPLSAYSFCSDHTSFWVASHILKIRSIMSSVPLSWPASGPCVVRTLVPFHHVMLPAPGAHLVFSYINNYRLEGTKKGELIVFLQGSWEQNERATCVYCLTQGGKLS